MTQGEKQVNFENSLFISCLRFVFAQVSGQVGLNLWVDVTDKCRVSASNHIS